MTMPIQARTALMELPIVEPSNGQVRDVTPLNDMVVTFDPANPPVMLTLPGQSVVTAAERRRERGQERGSKGKRTHSAKGRAIREPWMKETFPVRRCHDVPDDSKLYVSGFTRFNGRICNVYSVTDSSSKVRQEMLATARRELRKSQKHGDSADVERVETASVDASLDAFIMRPHSSHVMAHVNRKRKKK